MANKYMNIYSTSLIIREVQIKIMKVSCHLTPAKMTVTKTSKDRIDKDVEKIKFLHSLHENVD